MSKTNPLPTPAEVAERIRACREELKALTRLYRAAAADAAARDAKAKRSPEKRQRRQGGSDAK